MDEAQRGRERRPAPRPAELQGRGEPWVRVWGSGALLSLHVQPGAKSTGLAGTHGDALKVRVRAPAASGKANDALLRLLSGYLGLPVRSLSVLRGATSRDKLVAVAGLSFDKVAERLAEALPPLA